MLVAELRLRVGPVSLALWRTREPSVIEFMRHNMRRRLLRAVTDARTPAPIRRWASAKLNELARLEEVARRDDE